MQLVERHIIKRSHKFFGVASLRDDIQAGIVR